MKFLSSIQNKVFEWARRAFGDNVVMHRPERRERFAEECLELLQASGMSKEEIQRMMEYVYNRPAGEFSQEVAGVAITLDVFAASEGVDREKVVDAEYQRIIHKTDKICKKQLEKPRVSISNDSYPDREWQYLPTDRGRAVCLAFIDAGGVTEESGGKKEKVHLVWNPEKTEGFFTKDQGIAYEARKGAGHNCFDTNGNPSQLARAFCEIYSEEHDCTSEIITIPRTE